MRAIGGTLLRVCLVVTSLLVASCKLTKEPEEAAAPEPEAAAPEPEPIQLTGPAAPAPAIGDPAPADRASEREAGGRSLQWWQERLTALHKDGPADLYELALQRARANGLQVTVEAGGAVAVRSAPEERKP